MFILAEPLRDINKSNYRCRPEDGDILWRHPGNRSTSMVTAGAGALELVGLQLSDAGLYTCQQGDTAIHIVNLRSDDGVV